MMKAAKIKKIPIANFCETGSGGTPRTFKG